MNIYNVIILDESGSMSSIYKPTLAGMNEVLGGIRKEQQEHPEQRNFVTIVTFEGNGMKGIKTRRDRVPIESIRDFTEEDYRPGGCTPLFDAMGKTLNELEGLIQKDDRVMATIITDGMENSSEEYSGKVIKSLVDRLRGKGWTLAYIGANQDAVEVARELHITNGLEYCACDAGVAEMSRQLRKARARTSVVWSKMSEDGVFEEVRNIFEEGKD